MNRREWCEKRETMPTYIILNQLKEEALENLDSMEDQMAEDIGKIEEIGGEFHGLWMTFGQYDAVGVVDLPDDETALQFVAHLNQNRGSKTETMRAVPAEEASKAIAEGW